MTKRAILLARTAAASRDRVAAAPAAGAVWTRARRARVPASCRLAVRSRRTGRGDRLARGLHRRDSEWTSALHLCRTGFEGKLLRNGPTAPLRYAGLRFGRRRRHRAAIEGASRRNVTGAYSAARRCCHGDGWFRLLSDRGYWVKGVRVRGGGMRSDAMPGR